MQPELDTILHGECSRLLVDLPMVSIDLVVTSPPYGAIRDYEGFTFDVHNVAVSLSHVMKPGSVVAWNVGDPIEDGQRTLLPYQHAMAFQKAGFRVHDVMVVQRTNPIPRPRGGRYLDAHEYVLILSCGGPPRVFHPLLQASNSFGQVRSRKYREPDGILRESPAIPVEEEHPRGTVWDVTVGGKHSCRNGEEYVFDHPAVMPYRLAEDLILSYSNPGDLVLDPLCGSGTTLQAAQRLGRHYLGMEIAEAYVAIARKRIAQAELFGVDQCTKT